jgi:hypothetical protein
MHFRLTLLIASLILMATATTSAQSIQSVYTDLDQKKCKTLEETSDEGGSSKQQCPGVAGYKLFVLEGDLRQSITVVKPDGSEHALDLWSNVGGGGFSHLGPKAEWRVKRIKGKLVPIALIVRYEVSENAEDANKTTSYLTVAKITPQKICLTDSVSPQPNANVEARRLADNSAAKPCKAVQ